MPPNAIKPPAYVPIQGPLVFLAGPIQGAHGWQERAIELISEAMPGVHIASPRRANYEDSEFVYNEQVDWETHHLRRAAEHGVILFWLAKEADHDCSRAYAQTSRFELAEWKMRHERDGCKLVIGIEDGFSGAKYIRRRLGQDCPEIAICDSLEATCEKAVELLKAR